MLEPHGKDAPNMADLTVRMRELRRQRDDLDSELIDLEEVEEGDSKGMAELFRDIVTTTEDQNKLRLFFSSLKRSW